MTSSPPTTAPPSATSPPTGTPASAPTGTPLTTPSATAPGTPTSTFPPCTPLPAEPIAWWRGEGNADDSIGLAHGTVAGDAGFISGHVGQAFSFDAVEGVATFPGGDDLDVTGDELTLETWIKLEESQVDGQIFTGNIGKNDFPDGQAFVITFESGPIQSGVGPTLPPNQWQFEYVLTNASGNRLHDQATGVVITVDGAFHHVAMTYDGQNVRLFVDGEERYDRDFSGSLLSVPDVPVTIAGGAPFAADEVTIYGVALTTSEIGAIHAAGAGGKCQP